MAVQLQMIAGSPAVTRYALTPSGRLRRGSVAKAAEGRERVREQLLGSLEAVVGAFRTMRGWHDKDETKSILSQITRGSGDSGGGRGGAQEENASAGAGVGIKKPVTLYRLKVTSPGKLRFGSYTSIWAKSKLV